MEEDDGTERKGIHFAEEVNPPSPSLYSRLAKSDTVGL